MANVIKLKRGKSTDISKLTLQTGEIALTTDTNAILSMNSAGVIENITPKYTLTKSGSTITLSGTDGSSTSVSDSNTTYSAVTTTANGLMSKEDKIKLNNIAEGATKITIDSALSDSSTNPVQNKVINTALTNKLDITGNAATATKLNVAVEINGITFDGTGDIDVPANIEEGDNIAIEDNVISVPVIGNLNNLTVEQKDTLVSAINELKNLISTLETSIGSVSSDTDADIQYLQNQIDHMRENGAINVNELHNSLMDLDTTAALIGNETTTLQTQIDGQIFSVSKGSTNLLKLGVDADTNAAYAEMDNLEIKKHLTAGIHRQQKFIENNETRTGWFYIGGAK